MSTGGSSRGSSNPKYPGLTKTKMGSLWQEIKLGIGVLWKVSRGIVTYRDKYAAFRNKWGPRPPRSDKDWLQFWQEFVSLEDDLSSLSTELLDAHNVMRLATDEGMEIVRLNGIDDGEIVVDPIAYQERSLLRVKQIVDNRNE